MLPTKHSSLYKVPNERSYSHASWCSIQCSESGQNGFPSFGIAVAAQLLCWMISISFCLKTFRCWWLFINPELPSLNCPFYFDYLRPFVMDSLIDIDSYRTAWTRNSAVKNFIFALHWKLFIFGRRTVPYQSKYHWSCFWKLGKICAG